MQHPCRLMLADGQLERFAAVAFLADRVHQLRAGRAIATVACQLTHPDLAAAGVIIRDEETKDLLAVAIIGEPEYEAEFQDRLLAGALFRLNPDKAA